MTRKSRDICLKISLAVKLEVATIKKVFRTEPESHSSIPRFQFFSFPTHQSLSFKSERFIDEPVRLSNEPARIGGSVRLRNEPVRVVKNLIKKVSFWVLLSGDQNSMWLLTVEVGSHCAGISWTGTPGGIRTMFSKLQTSIRRIWLFCGQISMQSGVPSPSRSPSHASPRPLSRKRRGQGVQGKHGRASSSVLPTKLHCHSCKTDTH